jgi:hypothetical protein
LQLRGGEGRGGSGIGVKRMYLLLWTFNLWMDICVDSPWICDIFQHDFTKLKMWFAKS